MSTRCLIALAVPGGFRSIYCHSDGHPDGVGRLLPDHWSDGGKVKALVDLGDLSVLGQEIGRKHRFDGHDRNPKAKNWCLAYGRDRGEKDTEAGLTETFPELVEVAEDSGAEWLYLWLDECWLFAPVAGVGPSFEDMAVLNDESIRKHDPALTADVLVRDEGSLVLFQPRTEVAREWVEANVDPEAQWFGPWLVVEHRYAGDLIEGMGADGLRVVGE
jgi:hypothetical protein